ncbi:unnamed protein product [Linum tenue]|uniref:Uncharacterized protein n=1 Tax=Linum tenue TaxID=586396 RepID=A0AAV0IVD0_9ROSI|nr:unnamed protein product [Linum tenue]
MATWSPVEPENPKVTSSGRHSNAQVSSGGIVRNPSLAPPPTHYIGSPRYGPHRSQRIDVDPHVPTQRERVEIVAEDVEFHRHEAVDGCVERVSAVDEAQSASGAGWRELGAEGGEEEGETVAVAIFVLREDAEGEMGLEVGEVSGLWVPQG